MSNSQEGVSTASSKNGEDSSLLPVIEGGSSLLIVSEKLTLTNYRDWAQAVLLAVEGRGKKGFLTGETPAPADPKSKAMAQWKIDNALVSSWLINAMSTSIKRTFMYLPSARDIWVAVRESYVDGKDMSHLFSLQRQCWKSSQGTRTVTEYWFELCALWQEIDLLTDEEWACPQDAARNKKNKDVDRVLLFLDGLNPSFDDVSGRILGSSTLPSPREVYSEIRREETRKEVMLSSPILPTPDLSAMVSNRSSNNPSLDKGKLFCDHCKKTGHTRDRCWEIHGKPSNWKPRKFKSKAHQVNTDVSHTAGAEVDTSPLSQENVSQLLDLLKKLQVQPTPPTAALIPCRILSIKHR